MTSDLLPWAFAAGSAAALNACGFAVLPAYVAYQLGQDAGAARVSSAAHGLARGLVMTAGVITLFVLAGWAVGLVRAALVSALPWLAVLVGVVLLVLGAALLVRRSMSVELSLAGTLTRVVPFDRTWRATYLFGVGYGAASLGCTLPIFLAIAAQSLATRSVAEALTVFLAYGAGMGWLLTLVAVAAAVGNMVIIGFLRPMLQWVRTAGAVGMMAAGGYLVYYYRGVFGARL